MTTSTEGNDFVDIMDRQYARYDFVSQTEFRRCISITQKRVRFKEKLCNGIVCPLIKLVLEPAKILFGRS